jgi:hypothetical protein
MITLQLDLIKITIKTQKPTRDEFFSYLLEECSDLQPLLEQLDYSKQPELALKKIWNQYLMVKGHVQSGKTNFIIGVSLLCLWYGLSMIIILRNIQSDSKQFMTRLQHVQDKASAYVPVKIITSRTSRKFKPNTPRIYVCLGNNVSIQKITKLVDEQKYMVTIDEVDMMDMGRMTYRNETLTQLKKNACCVIGVSATMMDPICKENIKPEHVFILKSKSDYKGIQDISFVPLHGISEFSSRIDSNLLEQSSDLMPFLTSFSKLEPIRVSTGIDITFPNIALINICRTVEPYIALQKELMELPIATIVYNSHGVTLSYEQKIETRKMSISECLQWLKTNGGVERFPRIIIFSGDLAGRGISFTDTDFEWHLNQLFLIVSKQNDEAELIQKVRLCGRYKDSIPLTLYTTPAIYTDLLKSYFRQEEITTNLLNPDSEDLRMYSPALIYCRSSTIICLICGIFSLT